LKLIKLGLVLVVMTVLCAIGFYMVSLKQPLLLPDNEYHLRVKKGDSAYSLARTLHIQGIIPNSYLMKLYIKLNPQYASVKAGEYVLAQGITLPDMVKLISEGHSIQYPFTIVEGRNIKELLAEVRENKNIKNTLPIDNAETALMVALGEPEVFAEGVFLPETYYFSKGTTDIAFFKRARKHMKNVLEEAWENKSPDSMVNTPYEALILASIIEKETAAVQERPLISGVFTNRLRIGMKLQTDPTVIYGIGDQYDGDIRFRDLRTDTPYNTYTRYGLPPTPIAMPGKKAIEAALNPAETKALFFVSRNNGTHVFSETLAAHEAAVDQYQRGK